MEYIALGDLPHYNDCAPLIDGMGYILVDLKIIPQKGNTHLVAVIASKNQSAQIGINDCAKVHRTLQARLEALLGTENTSMELESPGIERNIKNAAEFSLFVGRDVRVWDKEVTDWVSGKISDADDKSVTLDLENGLQKKFEYENIAKAKFVN